ncbi:MAG: ATP-binding protein [Planctomycetota bacterium]
MNRARSLRLKLTVWYVLVFFGLQTVLIALAVYFRRDAIDRTLQDSRTEIAGSMADNIITAEIGWTDEELAGEIPKDVGIRLAAVRDQTGKVFCKTGIVGVDELPFDDWEAVPTGPVVPVHRLMGDDEAERVTGKPTPIQLVTVPFRHPDGDFLLQVGIVESAEAGVIETFFDLFFIGAPVGVLAAVAAAWIIAGRAVKPLDRLALAARSVSPARLGRRFDAAASDVEISRLAEELNHALERLEAGYRSQDQFVSNVSHELKTPLAVLLLQAQVARMGTRTPEDAVAFADHAERELKRLSRIVESFLVLARAQLTGNRPMPAVLVHDLVLQAVQHGSVLAEKKGVRLIAKLDEPEDAAAANGDGEMLEPVVSGDTELLQTVIDNLVRNAIAHSPPDEAIAIEAGRYGNEVRIAVRDRGPGIPEEYRERVFERFIQVPDADEQRERGTGLGLAIAHDVVRVHGGSVRVEGREGGGSSFLVVLPARLEEAL